MTHKEKLKETTLYHLKMARDNFLVLDANYDEGSMEKLRDLDEVFKAVSELSSLAESISNNS